MPEDITEMLREYRDGTISRREFIHRAVILTGSLAAATTLVDSLLAPPAYGAQVDPNDPALVSGSVQFQGPAGTISAYQSRPKAAGKYPGIIIVHANQGLDDHIRDVARRYAKEGYVALAPDYLSREGGTAKFPEANKGLSNIGKLATPEVITADSEAALKYLRSMKEVRSDRVGLTGFCWGGGRAFLTATQLRGLRAVVVFYGENPEPVDLVQHIEGPVLVHYAELDKRINDGIPATEAAMKKYNKRYEYKIYPGAQHAFFHDTRPDRYHAESAKEAWTRTLDFFQKHLKD